MCGIFGFWNPSQSDHGAADILARMGSALVHRGPDSDGVWVDRDRGIALGHRRLAILDLSEQGAQPMISASGRYVLTFNGEIYNFSELRADIEKVNPDIQWRGSSDTEVLAAAIDLWGLERALINSVGMFALAVWDRMKCKLHLARDRIGEKPLYYGRVGSAFVFASQLDSMRAHPLWRGEINREALTGYLRYSYVPAPLSIFTGIWKLPPRSILTLNSDELATSPLPVPQHYWRLSDAVEIGRAQPFSGSAHDAEDELDRLLSRSVKGQMIADVPFGAFLSGGIDSSIVVAMMQAQNTAKVRTFSIGFREQKYNEATYAAGVAAHLGTQHEEFYVTPNEAIAVIPELPRIYDEPFADSSQIPTFLVAKLARSSVTVALSGDGGDELFGGYNRYTWSKRISTLASIRPEWLKQALASSITGRNSVDRERLAYWITKLVPRVLVPTLLTDKLEKLAQILETRSEESLYRALVSIWQDPEEIVVGGEESTNFRDSWSNAQRVTTSLMEKMMFVDTQTYLCDDILVKVDRAAMANSLESRVPMLDHRVLEFSWGLPQEMSRQSRQGKQILKNVLYRYVPRALIDRPKMGFGVPIGEWLRGPLRQWAEELLSERSLREDGYFVVKQVRKKWEEHLSGARNWQSQLWTVLMFQAWLHQKNN